MTRVKPCRRSCRSGRSRNGRPAILAIDFGPSPVTLLNRSPAPPQRTIASGISGIDFRPLSRQRLVVGIFGLIENNVAAHLREGERNAQELLQTRAQRGSLFRGHVEEHKSTAACAQKLPTESARADPGFVNFVDVSVRDHLSKRS